MNHVCKKCIYALGIVQSVVARLLRKLWSKQSVKSLNKMASDLHCLFSGEGKPSPLH